MPPRALCLMLLAVASILRGQSGVGEIRLEVKDQSGAPMSVSGVLHGPGTAGEQAFDTDVQGRHLFEKLAPGRYRLQIAKTGFATQSVAVDVAAGATVGRSVIMALGTAAFKVDVVEAAPLPGVDLSPREIAAPVQTANERDLAHSGALDLSEFLNRRLDGVHVNQIQGNPLQADINYRGYTASPLLGTPQGLSVYMDGVRLNQPFGDVVSWDLIPRVAIAETTLMPGSNPIFGLNTLGGALAVTTKDGESKPGFGVSLSGGSFGRKSGELEYGGSTANGLSWYAASHLFFEDGWRAASPSDVRQFFGRFGRRRGNTRLGLTLSYANNALIGNGLQEQRFLSRDYRSVYTTPDITANRAPFFAISGTHLLASGFSVSGVAYYRYIRTNTLNGDVNEAALDQAVYQPSAADIRALTAAGYTGFPASGATAANTPFPFWRCIAQGLQRDEPGEKCTGLLNRTHTTQHNFGASGQATWRRAGQTRRNQFTLGAAYDGSVVRFGQSSQLGYVNPQRGITGIDAFADGVTGGQVDNLPFDLRVDLHGTIQTGSVYATDTFSAGRWNLTLSGRYNRTAIDNQDRIQPAAGTGSLTAAHAFGRLNPAVGVTYNAAGWANAYFGYGEGSRAPTAIELGCADPDSPCKLPNALGGDPPLQQVVTRTLEAGIRGGTERRLNWSAGWFRAENRDDILFVASVQSGFGYFKNFGQTRRQGVELDLNGRVGRLSLGGGYTFLNATYQSAETVGGTGNSSNSAALAGARGLDGTIRIQPGDRIPLIPRHLLKAFGTLQATRRLAVDLDFIGVSRSFARGNENNLSQPDGRYYLGPGSSPGYGLVNLGVTYQVQARVQLFAQINNVLDHRYYSAAQLGPTAFTDAGTFIARPLPAVNGEFPVVQATFYAPGAPLGAWGGIRLRF